MNCAGIGGHGSAGRIGREMAQRPADPDQSVGPNAWLVDEMYDRFRADPASVSESWRDFFTAASPVSPAVPAPPPGPPADGDNRAGEDGAGEITAGDNGHGRNGPGLSEDA